MSINPFYEDDMTSANFKRGLEAIFALVVQYAERMHGPMSAFAFDVERDGHGHDPLTGKYLKAPRRSPICDGKRGMGGALDRYFKAHWGLMRSTDMMDVYVSALVGNGINYGWALSQLAGEIPALMMASIEDFEIPELDDAALSEDPAKEDAR